MKKKNMVVLVDKQDNRLGLINKLEAHKGEGKMHRAISVLLYRENGKGKEILLQRRSKSKRLWGGYWANSCCTHPFPGEGYKECGARRLKEEMGIELDEDRLEEILQFDYQARYKNGLSENELDTVLVGKYEGEVKENKREVEEFEWVRADELGERLNEEKESFAPWFKMILKKEMVRKVLGV